jgi:hypothetical protein
MDSVWENLFEIRSWATPQAARQKWAVAIWAALCVIAVGAPYWPIISTGYRNTPGQEEQVINRAVARHGVIGGYVYFESHFWQREVDPNYVYYRPISILSHAIDYRLWRDNPHPSHAVNLGLHALNAILLGWLVALLAGTWLPGMLAAVLWALLPTDAEAVCWVAARMDVLCGTFSLAAMIAFVFAYRRRSWHLVPAGAVLFLLAVGSKETGGMFVVVVIAWALMAERGTRRIPFAAASLLTALGLAYVAWRYLAGTIIRPPQRHHFQHLAWRFHGYYLAKPLMKLYEAITMRSTLLVDWWGLLRGATEGVLLLGCLRVAALMLLWRIVFYLPALIFVQADDRYLYMPEMGSAALMALITWQTVRWLRRYREQFQWLPLAAYACLIGASVTLLLQQLAQWKKL